jgi:hypothetical protein
MMKKILLLLALYISAVATAQTPQTAYVVPTVAAMKLYFGNANRIFVAAENADFAICSPCTADEVNIYAGAAGKKWKKITPTVALPLIPPVLNTTAATTRTLDLSANSFFQLDMTAKTQLAFSSPIQGNLYSLRWFNNSAQDSLLFPSNLYTTYDSLSQPVKLTSAKSKSGYLQFYYDTAYYVTNRSAFTATTGGGGGTSYDASYQALLDYATVAGYTLPPDSIKAKQNQMIVSLKANNVWDSLDVFYAFAAGTSDTSFAQLNWKAPAYYKASRRGSVTYNAKQGMKGDGTTGWIETGVNLITNTTAYTANSSHFGVYSYDQSVPVNKFVVSSYAGSAAQVNIALRDGNASASYKFSSSQACNSDNSTISDAQTQGYFHFINSSNSGYAYRNGTLIADASVCTTTSATTDRPVILLARYDTEGSPNTGFANANISVFHAGGSLNSTKITSMNTIINTYISGL